MVYGSWDQSDNVLSIRHSKTFYVYDRNSRLVNAYLTNGYKLTYTYDLNGNLLRVSRELY